MSPTVKKGIKFSFSLTKPDQVTQDNFVEIEKWRLILYSMGLIGIDRNSQMSFGNISKKVSLNPPNCEIVITGSQTGQYPFLKANQYTKLIKCDVDRLKVSAIGPTAPSNQSLLHYIIYNSIPEITYIVIIEKDIIYDYFVEQGHKEFNKDKLYTIKEKSNVFKYPNIESDIGLLLARSSKKRIIFYSSNIDSIGKYILELNKNFKSN